MRVLCLDVGTRRIGVAVTDPLDITAQGVETIHTRGMENDIARVKELCAAYDTRRVLLGLPRNMDGSEGFQAEYCSKFGDRLCEEGFQVRYQDERLTSSAATRTLIEGGVRREKRKGVIDKLAACYILQSFMDSGGWKDADSDKPTIETKREVFRMSDERNNELDMEQDNIVELFDEDGNALKFEHLMTLEYNGDNYICLAPAEPMADVEEDEMVIMRIEEDAETGEDVYATIDNEDELNAVFEEYLRIAEADE